MHEINKILKPKSEEDILSAMDDSGLSLNDLLAKSARAGFVKGVQLALKKGADVHVWNEWPLRTASELGHLEVVKLLLKAGADVHVWYDSALRYASKNGHIEIVKILKNI